MQSDFGVLSDTVVEGGRLPVVEEEDHGGRLAEVVELQTSGANGVEDRCIVDGADGYGEFAGADDEVGVRGGSACLSAVG